MHRRGRNWPSLNSTNTYPKNYKVNPDKENHNKQNKKKNIQKDDNYFIETLVSSYEGAVTDDKENITKNVKIWFKFNLKNISLFDRTPSLFSFNREGKSECAEMKIIKIVYINFKCRVILHLLQVYFYHTLKWCTDLEPAVTLMYM